MHGLGSCAAIDSGIRLKTDRLLSPRSPALTLFRLARESVGKANVGRQGSAVSADGQRLAAAMRDSSVPQTSTGPLRAISIEASGYLAFRKPATIRRQFQNSGSFGSERVD